MNTNKQIMQKNIVETEKSILTFINLVLSCFRMKLISDVVAKILQPRSKYSTMLEHRTLSKMSNDLLFSCKRKAFFKSLCNLGISRSNLVSSEIPMSFAPKFKSSLKLESKFYKLQVD